MHGNKDCGYGDGRSDPVARIVSPGARKEKLRQRAWKPVASRASPRPYAELHAASAFSFLDGASPPEDLVGEAARLSLPAVALLDRNGVYGAPRFFKTARSAGIRALVGAEVTVSGAVGEGLAPSRPGEGGRAPSARRARQAPGSPGANGRPYEPGLEGHETVPLPGADSSSRSLPRENLTQSTTRVDSSSLRFSE